MSETVTMVEKRTDTMHVDRSVTMLLHMLPQLLPICTIATMHNFDFISHGTFSICTLGLVDVILRLCVTPANLKTSVARACCSALTTATHHVATSCSGTSFVFCGRVEHSPLCHAILIYCSAQRVTTRPSSGDGSSVLSVAERCLLTSSTLPWPLRRLTLMTASSKAASETHVTT